MSLADQMKTVIEDYADELLATSPIVPVIVGGGLKPGAMALYLESLRYLFANSEVNIKRAAAAAACDGRPELSEYFWQKAREEQGHDLWAISDLEKLPAAARVDLKPAAAIKDLVVLQGQWIDRDPLLFAAYAQWAEYFSVYIGDAWLNALEFNGYPRDQVSAISKHLDPDQDHATTGFRELEKFARGGDAIEMLAVIRQAGQTFSGLLAEMASC